jgi:transcription elongation factor SPT4
MSSNNTAQLPPTKRQLRACMLCSLIKTAAQFRDFGCDNCESILKLTRSTERINDCTTTQFEGYLIILK